MSANCVPPGGQTQENSRKVMSANWVPHLFSIVSQNVFATCVRRFKSYRNWSREAPSRNIMARAGFVSYGDQYTVRCFVNNCEITDVREVKNPWDIHLMRFPHCPLVQMLGPGPAQLLISGARVLQLVNWEDPSFFVVRFESLSEELRIRTLQEKKIIAGAGFIQRNGVIACFVCHLPLSAVYLLGNNVCPPPLGLLTMHAEKNRGCDYTRMMGGIDL